MGKKRNSVSTHISRMENSTLPSSAGSISRELPLFLVAKHALRIWYLVPVVCNSVCPLEELHVAAVLGRTREKALFSYGEHNTHHRRPAQCLQAHSRGSLAALRSSLSPTYGVCTSLLALGWDFTCVRGHVRMPNHSITAQIHPALKTLHQPTELREIFVFAFSPFFFSFSESHCCAVCSRTTYTY